MGRKRRLLKRIRRLSGGWVYLLRWTSPERKDCCTHDVEEYIRAGYRCPDMDENTCCNEIPF